MPSSRILAIWQDAFRRLPIFSGIAMGLPLRSGVRFDFFGRQVLLNHGSSGPQRRNWVFQPLPGTV